MRVGQLGTGRMGTAIARRLIDAGHQVTVWNRTAAKAGLLVGQGAVRAATLAELAACPVVFVSVSSSEDLLAVLDPGDGLLSAADGGLRTVVDCSTVAVDASAAARELCARAGVAFLAAPISGNPEVVGSGRACLVASGPADTFSDVEPLLRAVGRIVVHAGEREQARLVKLAHNLYLGALAQALVEVTTLVEKAGTDRRAFLDFLGNAVVGSEWVRQRTPDLADRDWTPTFTGVLLRKDLDLGLAAAREHQVPMPVVSMVHQLVQQAIGHGHGEKDLLALYEIQAAAAGLADHQSPSLDDPQPHERNT
ncbi:3-hydroxyisobutyrate dehydrogenase-like beta-hydroxyacid dehydrogenase [Micromonospora sp. Llam0]|uniref:NAD(P)-dependent oxidoreductase n=1 Tax=Micromonospora sp. Llam0 TaxID=2485143 RepID=UPI000F4A91DD|nr:NAD(P)-dependent oxidoreductase [Micromonospora sp. Llam0]ROO59209.1 3-hydroxyisobutyrate dehydrogenase-like beta-hydroxyacid dehydrogenase [Micromonospora sp. Llam0]